MKKKTAREQRKFQRLNIALQVKYSFSVKKRTLMEKVFSKNISGGGISLVVERPLKIGQKLKTIIRFPQDRHPISAVSQVVWCKKRLVKKKERFELGIRHLGIAAKDKERFIFLFCELMINYFLTSANIK